MPNPLNSPVCFHLSALPDVQSPRLLMALGQQAAALAEQVVFDSLMLLASHPDDSKNLVFTLRYYLDSDRELRKRLRLYVILAAEQPDFSPASFQMAVTIVQMQLGTCFGTSHDREKKDDVRTGLPIVDLNTEFASFWKSEPSICHITKREFIQADKADSRTKERSFSAIRPSGEVMLDELGGVYLSWPYRSDRAKPALDALFWDRLADAVAVRSEAGYRRRFCVDLVFRPIHLLPDDDIWEGLNAQLSRSRALFGEQTATMDMATKVYQEYWDLCAQGSLFDFGMRVAGTESDSVEWLAGSLATGLTSGGRFVLRPLENKSVSWEYSVQAALEGSFHLAFVKPELPDSPSSHNIKYWSDILRTKTGVELMGGAKRNTAKLAGLAHLRHLVGPETAREFLRLPIPHQGYAKTILLDTEVSPEIGDDVILGPETERDGEAMIPLRELRNHMFVAGATGSGKTTTLYHILTQLWERFGIPFLVIEPVKKQYRALKSQDGCLWPNTENRDLSKDLIVLTAGQSKVSSLRFNPLRFSAVTRNEHISMLETCFRGALPFFDPLPAIFMELLETIYIEKGFDCGSDTGLDSLGQPKREDTFPTIEHLITYWRKNGSSILRNIGYTGEVEADLRGALVARMKELDQPYLRELFALPRLDLIHPSTNKELRGQPKYIDLPFDEVLSRPVILELDALNKRQANLVTLFVLAAIHEMRKVQGQTSNLQHLLVIEEAHNLVGHSKGMVSEVNHVDPEAEATQFLVRMLAEVRALGQGLVIVDQTPAAVAPEVLKNTNLKLIQRTTDGEDRAALGSNMLLSEAQIEETARLGPGFGYFYRPGLFRPVGIEVKVPERLKELSNHTLVDEELRHQQLAEVCDRLSAINAGFATSWSEIPSQIKFELYMAMLHYREPWKMFEDADLISASVVQVFL